VNVIGHDDITEDVEVIFVAGLFEDPEKGVA
jgi:hypothetical protein